MFSLSNDRFVHALLTVGFLGMGAFAGLVVSTGSPTLIAFAVGALTGVMLLNFLQATVWLLVGGVLFMVGPIMYFVPELNKLSWLFSVLGFFMLGSAILYLGIGRRQFQRPMPAHVILAMVVMAYAVLSLLFSNGSFDEWSGAFKRQFHFWGMILLLAAVPFAERSVRGWLKLLLLAAIVQLPVAAYQRFVLMPRVEGLEKPGFVPFDIITGTFEGSPTTGGASAVMAMYLVLAAISLVCAYRERAISGSVFWLLLLLVIAPLGLGETKVVLFLIPLALLGAFSDLVLRKPLAFLGATVVTGFLSAVLVFLYFTVQVDGRDMTLQDRIDETISYNVGNTGYYGTGVNRLTAVPYWVEQHHLSDPARPLFGYGMGASYGADGHVPVTGHIFDAHPGQHIDLTTAATILWDYGAFGGLLWIAMLLSAWIAASRSLKEARTPLDRTLCRILLASLAITPLMLMYSSSPIQFPTHTMLLALTLGLVAWRARNGPMSI